MLPPQVQIPPIPMTFLKNKFEPLLRSKFKNRYLDHFTIVLYEKEKKKKEKEKREEKRKKKKVKEKKKKGKRK